MMNSVPSILISLLLGFCGWAVASLLRLPAASVLGPMVLVGIAACAGLVAVALPGWVKLCLQVVVGTFVGARVTRETIVSIRRMGLSVALVTGWVISSALATGYVVGWLSGMDLASSLLGCSPGGLTEMSAMAVSVGADGPTVAVLQTARLITTLGVIPLLARRGQDRMPTATVDSTTLSSSPPYRFPGRSEAHVDRLWTVQMGPVRQADATTLIIGAAGAVPFSLLGVPGGGLVGSLLLVAMANVIRGRVASPPSALRTIAQVGMGVVLGAGFTRDTASRLVASVLPMLGATAATVVSGLVLSGLVRRQLGSDRVTALLACAPAGLSQMVLIADELGADVLTVSIFQLTRLVCAVVVLPFLLRLLL